MVRLAPSHPASLELYRGLGTGLWMSDEFNRYKMEALKRRRPAVVSLGSSRVMQFRQFMFAPLTFYNAGGLLQDATDLYAYVDLLDYSSLLPKELSKAGIPCVGPTHPGVEVSSEWRDP